jgi:hypothetical protein
MLVLRGIDLAGTWTECRTRWAAPWDTELLEMNAAARRLRPAARVEGLFSASEAGARSGPIKRFRHAMATTLRRRPVLGGAQRA